MSSFSSPNPVNHNKIRDNTIALFSKKLTKLNDIQIRDLEIGIFNFTLDYATNRNIPLTWSSNILKDIYIAKARSVYSNLNPDCYIGNENLISLIYTGDDDIPLSKKKTSSYKTILPHDIAFMTHEEMYPDRWRVINEITEKKMKEAFEVKAVAMIDTIYCKKCKSNKISYYDYQIRSSDESASTFFTCLNCNFKWKQG
jgi:DNA-directed RNA polymerase subunit M/transcription elongation factor TFIIS